MILLHASFCLRKEHTWRVSLWLPYAALHLPLTLMYLMLFVVFFPHSLWFLLPCRTQYFHAALGCWSLPHSPALPGPVWSIQHPNIFRLLSPSSSALSFPNIAYLPACLPAFLSLSLLYVVPRNLYMLSVFTKNLLLILLTISIFSFFVVVFNSIHF